MVSGRSAISFSAAPATAKSDADALIGTVTLPVTVGITTSCSVSLVTSWPPKRPSRSKRSVSLRPIIPAAPRISACMAYSLTAPVIAET
jgi:hypothetical protein